MGGFLYMSLCPGLKKSRFDTCRIKSCNMKTSHSSWQLPTTCTAAADVSANQTYRYTICKYNIYVVIITELQSADHLPSVVAAFFHLPRLTWWHWQPDTSQRQEWQLKRFYWYRCHCPCRLSIQFFIDWGIWFLQSLWSGGVSNGLNTLTKKEHFHFYSSQIFLSATSVSLHSQ